MTVTTTANSIQYAGNGVTTSFSFPYVFFANGDLVVTLFNTSTNLDVTPAPVLNGTATYDYTISGTFDSDRGEYVSGANVVFNTAPATGLTVVIVRDVAATQDADLLSNTKFPANTVNGALDKVTVLVQQSLAASDLSLKIPVTDPAGTSVTLPPAGERASMYLGFDSSSEPVALAAPANTTAVTTYMATVLLSANAAAAQLLLGISTFWTGVLARATAALSRDDLAAFGVARVQTFTANGTYTPNSKMLYCKIEAVGGGGGGGGCSAAAANIGQGGAGGGAGGYSSLVASAATIGASKAVTIGAAGAGGARGANAGSAGGDTSVGTICIAKGGSGGGAGNGANVVTGGTGGIAGTGDVTATGASGQASGVFTNGFGMAGGGGSGPFGGGTAGAGSSSNIDGGAATGKGAGGGGGASYNGSGAGNTGGAGTAGYVLITEFCSS